MEDFFDTIRFEAEATLRALLTVANLKEEDILVVGCSTSEVLGKHIGKGSSAEVADAIYSAFAPIAAECGFYLSFQCCEHLNRALVVERACMEKYHLEEVTVRPALHAGGAMAMRAFESFRDPCVVETIQAHAGIDIGDTLIGMHLRRVAVPVRCDAAHIGEANIVMARTRPKYIGGPRAQYDTDAR